MNAAPSLLSLENAWVEFPDAGAYSAVVRGVSWQLAAGERVGLVGESGSGKTLSALAALHLVPPPGRLTRGVVRYDGTSLGPAEVTALRGRRVGVVLQEAGTAFNPVFSVAFQLRETVRALTGAKGAELRRRVDELLGQVGLDAAAAAAYPHQLSGGQLQRALIATALAGAPRALIADEPTTALDLRTQATILNLFRRISDELGVALLLISHDLTVVAGLVQRMVVMFGGEVVEEGPTAVLLDNPMHPYTRLLLGAFHAVEESRPTAAPSRVEALPDKGCRFRLRCPVAAPDCRLHHPELATVTGGHRLRCPVMGGSGGAGG